MKMDSVRHEESTTYVPFSEETPASTRRKKQRLGTRVSGPEFSHLAPVGGGDLRVGQRRTTTGGEVLDVLEHDGRNARGLLRCPLEGL